MPQTRRIVAALLGFVVMAGVIGVVSLFLVTPSVSGAWTLATGKARAQPGASPTLAPPARFTTALIATEDHRFYSSFDLGIDPVAVARVLLGRILGRGDQGGAGIAQQLAKMLYTPGEHGPLVEAKQLALAVKLTLRYSKAEILRMYSEVVYFGGGYTGLEAASFGYFGKRPADLSWTQAAMLAGVVNAPSADDPRCHPKHARAREAHVLSRLIAVGAMSAERAHAALDAPLGLIPRSDGLACGGGAAGAPRGTPGRPTGGRG